MKTVIQRVKNSSVIINKKVYNKISRGLLVFLGIEKGDSCNDAEYLARKIVELRIFPDASDKMNLSIKDINGEILVISQFTLCTVEKSGNRPGFSNAELPGKANEIYEFCITKMKNYYDENKVFSGIFGADMIVSSDNYGPVTIILEK